MLYLDLVNKQYFAHIALRSTNFDLRLFVWKYIIPFIFVLNKINYAIYGSFHTESVGNIEKFYPNLKPLLETKGLLVQGQDYYAIRTSIDQRGEQTVNQDTKTSSGIKSLMSNEKSVLKWCLNRSEQTSNGRTLIDLCGVVQLAHDVVTTLLFGCLLVATSDSVKPTLSQHCPPEVVAPTKI